MRKIHQVIKTISTKSTKVNKAIFHFLKVEAEKIFMKFFIYQIVQKNKEFRYLVNIEKKRKNLK